MGPSKHQRPALLFHFTSLVREEQTRHDHLDPSTPAPTPPACTYLPRTTEPTRVPLLVFIVTWLSPTQQTFTPTNRSSSSSFMVGWPFDIYPSIPTTRPTRNLSCCVFLILVFFFSPDIPLLTVLYSHFPCGFLATLFLLGWGTIGWGLASPVVRGLFLGVWRFFGWGWRGVLWIEGRDGVFEETVSQRGRRGFERMELLSFGVGQTGREARRKSRGQKFLGQGLTRRRSVPFFDSLCSELVPT